jgi:hypothetical protein
MRNSRRPSDADVDPEQDPLSPYSSPTVRRSADRSTQPIDDTSSGTTRGSGTQVDGTDFASRQNQRRQRQSNARVYPSRIGEMARGVNNRQLLMVGGGIILLLVLLLAWRTIRNRNTAGTTTPNQPAPFGTTEPALLATIAPGEQPSGISVTPAPIEIAPTTAAPAATGATGAFVVTNTGSEGLFLRADPATTGTQMETLPEGSKVDALGPEQNDGTRTWKKVKAPDGQEGWVAAEFLVAAP